MKNPHASALGKLGGRARAKKLSPARRSEIASNAAKIRMARLTPEERKLISLRASAGRKKQR